MTVPSDAELAEYRRRAEETIAVQHAYQRGYNDGRAAAVPPRPAAPDATAGDGLREALRDLLIESFGEYPVRNRDAWLAEADAVLALPALRDVLAAAARDAERVARVRELAEDYEGYVIDRGRPTPGTYDHGLNMAQAAAATDLRRALDPS